MGNPLDGHYGCIHRSCHYEATFKRLHAISAFLGNRDKPNMHLLAAQDKNFFFACAGKMQKLDAEVSAGERAECSALRRYARLCRNSCLWTGAGSGGMRCAVAGLAAFAVFNLFDFQLNSELAPLAAGRF